MKNLAQKKLFGYLIGVLCICFWAVFSLISYDISMILTILALMYSQVIEGLEFKEANNMKKFRFHVVLAILLVIVVMVLITIKV